MPTMPTMGDSIKQGLGLGIGLEGARAAMGAVGSMMGNTQEQVQQQSNDSNKTISELSLTPQTHIGLEDCNIERKLLKKCMEEHFDNEQYCTDFIKLFNKCTNVQNG